MAGALALDVVTVGEAMALLAALSPGPMERVGCFARHGAGAELNVAIGLSRLGLRVGYLTRVGNDVFGRFLLDVLSNEKIDRSRVEVDEHHPTGLMMKSKSDNGMDPAIEYRRRGSAASRLTWREHMSDYFGAARHLHITGITPALSSSCRELVFNAAHRARESGQSVSFDPNLRPQLWASPYDMISTLNALASLSDLVLPGLAEGRVLTGRGHAQDIADFYLERGAKHVVVKLGQQGAYCASLESPPFTLEGRAVSRVIDSVGAGDGFAVGVISALLEGLSLEQAVDRGNAIGARVVQFPGDSDGLPTREELCAISEERASTTEMTSIQMTEPVTTSAEASRAATGPRESTQPIDRKPTRAATLRDKPRRRQDD